MDWFWAAQRMMQDSKVVMVTSDLDGNWRIINDPSTPDTGNAAGPQSVEDMGAYEFSSKAVAIPSVSAWGAVVLAFLILGAGSLDARRGRIGVG